MPNLGRDNKTAVFQFLFNDLIGNQLAALEVTGNLACNFENNLLILLAQPNTVFLSQLLVDFRIVGKMDILLAQLFDLGKREGLEFVSVTSNEIPDPLVIHQLEWGDISMGFAPLIFDVIEGNMATGVSGFVEMQ